MNQTTSKKIANAVSTIIDRVRRNGDAALALFLKKFDKVSIQPKKFRISASEVTAALKQIDPQTKSAITDCASRIKTFHQNERKNIQKSWKRNQDGVTLGQIIRPVESVGIYVPGGRFSYPSTVLMAAIPAKIAGVKKIVLVTPPQNLTDELLASAEIAGVDEIFQIGGPAAVAALAIGTRNIPKVDLIVGPGNAYVTEAKRQLYGEVGIDLLAGPSELVILADKSAKADFIAADLAAQAEHDPMASSTLISTDRKLPGNVKALLPQTKLGQCKFVFEPDLKKALFRLNQLAGEHVEILVKNPQKILGEIKNGGAIFIGPYSPAVMGDYWAGPSHVLPTGRSARFSSGLSVANFLKRSSLIQVSPAAFARGGKSAYKMAVIEGLMQHANSIKIRLK